MPSKGSSTDDPTALGCTDPYTPGRYIEYLQGSKEGTFEGTYWVQMGIFTRFVQGCIQITAVYLLGTNGSTYKVNACYLRWYILGKFTIITWYLEELGGCDDDLFW